MLRGSAELFGVAKNHRGWRHLDSKAEGLAWL